jgi:O-antigen/teichoic acid export membrane protein
MPWLVGGRIFGLVLGLAGSVLIGRTLGPAGKGVVGGVVLISSIVVALGNLGVGQGAFFFQSRREVPSSVSFSMLTLVGTAVMFVAGLLMIVPARTTLESVSGPLPGMFLAAGLVLGGLTILGTAYSDLLRGLGLAHLASLIPIGAQFVYVATIVGVLAGGGGAWGITLAYLAAAAVTIGLSLLSFHRLGVLHYARQPGTFRKFVGFGRPLYVNGIVVLVLTRFNQVVVLSRLGVAELGQFGVAVALAEMLWLIDLPLIGAAQFHVASRPREGSIDLVNRMTRLVCATLLVAAATLASVAFWLVPGLFGNAFRPAVAPLILYLPGVVAWGVGRSVSQYIGFHLGRNDVNLWTNVAGSILSVSATFAVVNRWGIKGVSLVTSLAYFIMAVFLVAYYVRSTGGRLREVLIPTQEDLTVLIVPRWHALVAALGVARPGA